MLTRLICPVLLLGAVSLGQKPDDCWNNYPCCDTWSDRGYCASKFQFMRLACPVSCGLCTPNYEPCPCNGGRCFDHFSDCRAWAARGSCRNSDRYFMEENCRRACNLCGTWKSAGCGRPPNLECYNDDPCCDVLKRQRGCNNHYMRQYCRRECGICDDKINEHSPCMDFFPLCQYKAKNGACERASMWMTENCRAACGKCHQQPRCPQDDQNTCGRNEDCTHGDTCHKDCSGNTVCSRSKRNILHSLTKRNVEAAAWAPVAPAAPPPPVGCTCVCKRGFVRRERDTTSPCIRPHQCPRPPPTRCGRNEVCTRDLSQCDEDCDGNKLCSINRRKRQESGRPPSPLAPPPPASCICRCKRGYVRKERDDSSDCIPRHRCRRRG